MTEFFCNECADKSDEAESLTVGCLGIRTCDVCGRRVNCETEDYHVFREDAKVRLKIKEESQANTQQLQAKIAALADELELINRDDFYNGKHVTIAGRMRQLSAVQ